MAKVVPVDAVDAIAEAPADPPYAPSAVQIEYGVDPEVTKKVLFITPVLLPSVHLHF